MCARCVCARRVYNEFKGYFFRCFTFFMASGAGWNLWSPVCMLNIRNVLSNFQGLRQGHAFYQHIVRIGHTHISSSVLLMALHPKNRHRSAFVCCDGCDNTVENIRMEKVSGKRVSSNITTRNCYLFENAAAFAARFSSLSCTHTLPLFFSITISLSVILQIPFFRFATNTHISIALFQPAAAIPFISISYTRYE